MARRCGSTHSRIRSRLHILAAEFLHAKFHELLSTSRWHDLSAVGNGKASFVDTRDIAAVAAEALTSSEHEGKTYTLTGPAALGIAEVASILSEVAGREINYIDVPESAARDGMLQAGLPRWQVDALMELPAANKQNRWSTVTSDIEKVTAKPATSFAQYARDHSDRFRAS
jgi:uncharacterized protein YbjT (DUF2867 family)